jgi:hypothetical protein
MLSVEQAAPPVSLAPGARVAMLGQAVEVASQWAALAATVGLAPVAWAEVLRPGRVSLRWAEKGAKLGSRMAAADVAAEVEPR